MNRLFKLLALALVGVLALVALMAVVGAFLPKTHTVASSAFFHQPVDSLWAAVVDIERSPSWRTDVHAVERLPDRHGNPVWNQISAEGSWPLEVLEAIPNVRYKARVGDDAQGFGGAWTYFFAGDSSGTRLTIHEEGFISNPFFRVMANYVYGMNDPMDSYLKALGRKFGEAVKPTHAG